MTQEEALKILKTGANVFLTGEPGSGKTYTVNAYTRYLRDHGIEPAVTASTGIAATHIGGMTIHSWSGIGVKEYLTEYDVEAIAGNANVRRRAKNTHVLIIDEISMLSGDTLGMVDQVLRAVRERDMPFGGMQVVVVGDFFQLPPIVKHSPFRQTDFDDIQTPFAFAGPSWRALNPFVCYLEEQFRQHDAGFSSLLQGVRNGNTEQHKKTLDARRADEKSAPEHAPRLFSHNKDVDRINDERLAKMGGKPYHYAMHGKGAEGLVATLKRGCLSPELLILKEGARVMFTKNDPGGKFVNGTLGEVVSIAMDSTPLVRTKDGRTLEVEAMEWTIEDGGRVLARITQLPLRLAWAITVHKSQGMTLDEAVVDLTHAFEYGQGYVALSRVKDLSGLHLLGYNKRSLEVHPEVQEVDTDFKERSKDACEHFTLMRDAEHREYVERFIKACGGSLEGGVVPTKKKLSEKKTSTADVTKNLIVSGKSLKEIAKMRKLKEGTIIDHAYNLYMKDEVTKKDVEKLVSSSLKRALPKIFAAFKRHGTDRLTPVYQELKGVNSFDELRLARILFD